MLLRTLALTAAGLVLSCVASAAPASADEAPARPLQITVIGDSITAWFRDDPGSISQGWWSMMGRELGASVTTLAEAGSGMNVRGNNCYGTTFGQRLSAITKVDFVIIQGGRNDMYGCTATTEKRTLSRAEQRKGISAFMSRLAARVDALGIPRSHVLVVSPWGKADRARGYAIQGYLRLFSNRNHQGFTYVESKTLPPQMTLDNKHPNREGSAYLSGTMIRAINALS